MTEGAEKVAAPMSPSACAVLLLLLLLLLLDAAFCSLPVLPLATMANFSPHC